MRRSGLAVALPLLTLLACGTADEVKCQPGYAMCGDVCVSASAFQDDEQNCGACGNTCGAGQLCSAGSCVPDCASSLRVPVVDRWGTAWDGLERPGASWADAKATCEAFGGRLPTATEIHRVSWAKTADVGQSYQTNALWTLVPRDPGQMFTGRMSDGGTLVASATVGPPWPSFRCVCPTPTPDTFTGRACNGQPGQECFALDGPNAGYDMDAQDRAPLTVGGAMWECGFAGGQLPRFLTYAEAILQGLPGGSTGWLHTGDLVHAGADSVVKWNGTQPSWPITGNTSYGGLLDVRPFRCVGRASAPAPNADRPADAFVGATGLAADAADRTATGWAAAHDACWAAGGHLPFSTELGALVQQGLGGGTGAGLWTAEQEGHDGGGPGQFLAGYLKWTGTPPTFGHYAPDYVSWFYRSDPSHAHRCAYYPVDPAHAPPIGCNGACEEFPLTGTSGARLWVDSLDRGNATLIAAIGTCRGLGAHLATERDYTEVIRKGLANGSSDYLHAADLAIGNGATVNSMVVRWTNIDRSYDDQYTAYSTWSGVDALRPYRCVWTNEVR